MVNAANTPVEDENLDPEATAEAGQPEVPAFPTSFKDTKGIFEYARHHVEDEEKVKQYLADFDEACEKKAGDSVIAGICIELDKRWPMTALREWYNKKGKNWQIATEKLTTPLPLQAFNLGPIQLFERFGFLDSKRHVVPGDREKTEENIRKAGGLTRLLAEKGLKMGSEAAKLSKNPKYEMLALMGPFVEVFSRGLDSLEKGAANIRTAVLEKRAEHEAQQRDIEQISKGTQESIHAIQPLNSNLKNLKPVNDNASDTDSQLPLAS
jgi:hypothetical protein